MLEPLTVTLLPVLFLVVLFGGGAAFRRRQIDMDGEPPVDRRLFYTSKYVIVVLWGTMVARSWSAPVSFVAVPRSSAWAGLFLWASVFYTLNPIVLALGVFVCAVHHRIVLAEERYLAAAFGSDYTDYCRRVRRYLQRPLWPFGVAQGHPEHGRRMAGASG